MQGDFGPTGGGDDDEGDGEGDGAGERGGAGVGGLLGPWSCLPARMDDLAHTHLDDGPADPAAAALAVMMAAGAGAGSGSAADEGGGDGINADGGVYARGDKQPLAAVFAAVDDGMWAHAASPRMRIVQL